MPTLYPCTRLIRWWICANSKNIQIQFRLVGPGPEQASLVYSYPPNSGLKIKVILPATKPVQKNGEHMAQQKKYCPSFKTKVALEAVKGGNRFTAAPR